MAINPKYPTHTAGIFFGVLSLAALAATMTCYYTTNMEQVLTNEGAISMIVALTVVSAIIAVALLVQKERLSKEYTFVYVEDDDGKVININMNGATIIEITKDDQFKINSVKAYGKECYDAVSQIYRQPLHDRLKVNVLNPGIDAKDHDAMIELMTAIICDKMIFLDVKQISPSGPCNAQFTIGERVCEGNTVTVKLKFSAEVVKEQGIDK